MSRTEPDPETQRNLERALRQHREWMQRQATGKVDPLTGEKRPSGLDPEGKLQSGFLDEAFWPGGVPIIYQTEDGGTLCPECANGGNGSEASVHSDDPQWHITGYFPHEEGPPEVCDHCGAEVESAYGDPEAEDEEDEED